MKYPKWSLFHRPEDDRWSGHRVGKEPPRRHHPHRLLPLSLRPPGPSNLHGRVDAEVCQGLPHRPAGSAARPQRVGVCVSQSLARVRTQLQQLVLDGGQARSSVVRQLERRRHLPRQLHVPPGLREKPQLRLHKFWYLRLGVPFGFPVNDSRLLGRTVPGDQQWS